MAFNELPLAQKVAWCVVAALTVCLAAGALYVAVLAVWIFIDLL